VRCDQNILLIFTYSTIYPYPKLMKLGLYRQMLEKYLTIWCRNYFFNFVTPCI